MISGLYELLKDLGYAHPIHPPLTHLPIGLVVLVFLNVVWGMVTGKHLLQPRPCYRIVLVALVFLLPVVATGYTDWVHFYEGAWLFEIKVKYALTGVLLLALVVGAVVGYAPEPRSKRNLVLYLVCFAAVVGLGYFGAQLVLQDISSEAPKAVRGGERLFAAHCAECHAVGDLAGSEYLRSSDEFSAFLEDPAKVAGTPLAMPAFPKKKLSPKDAKKLLDFVRVSGCVEQAQDR